MSEGPIGLIAKRGGDCTPVVVRSPLCLSLSFAFVWQADASFSLPRGTRSSVGPLGPFSGAPYAPCPCATWYGRRR